MRARSILLPCLSLLGAALASGCDRSKEGPVGSCTEYSAEGVCAPDGEGTFSFVGEVEGESVSYAANPLADGQSLDAATDCVLQVTDSPCAPLCAYALPGVDPYEEPLGSCGEEATSDNSF